MIWYACYGSNMDETRFLRYINDCPTDINPPREFELYSIYRRFYFAENSQRWNGGVGFVSTKIDSRSLTYAKLYLISRDQFSYLFNAENGRRTSIMIDYNHFQNNKMLDISTDRNGDPIQIRLYNRIIKLEESYKGYPILTFTNSRILPRVKPADEYVELINNGLRITHNLSDEDIARYIKKAKRR